MSRRHARVVTEIAPVTIPERKRDKVAICGFTQHGLKAPFTDETWDLWGLNDLHAMFEMQAPGIFQTDRVEWFQIHHAENGEYPGARDPEHTKWLSQQTIPIWMWEHHDVVPASIPYPLREVLSQAVLPNGQPMSPEAYFNNTISWMIALAILRGYKTIGVYGVDMAMDGIHGQSEYTWQRPSVEYFLGVCRGLGIDLVIPVESELLKTAFLYGYDNSMPIRRKWVDRLEQLDLTDQETSAEYEAVKRALHETRGAIWAIEQLLPQLPPGIGLDKKLVELQQREITIVNEYEALKRSLAETRGAKHNMLWSIRNYFPGEGSYQDQPRTEMSLLRSGPQIEDLAAYGALPAASDGQSPLNRIKRALETNKGSADAPVDLTLPVPEVPFGTPPTATGG